MECNSASVLLVILLVTSMTSSTISARHSQKKDELIQDTVRKFLGVRSEDRTSSGGRAQNQPPRYMMELYERYRSGQAPMQGNTVRSILATKDPGGNMDMLTFNLTGLKSAEQILESKIYLLQRPKKKNGKKKDHSSFRINIGCLPHMTAMHYVDVELDRQKPDWQSYDISEAVVSCRQAKDSPDSLMGLTLEVKRSRGRHRFISFKRIVKKNSQPFVLIFSEDSQNQTSIAPNTRHEGYDEIRDLLRLKANAEGMSRSPKLPQTQNQRGRRTLKLGGRRSEDYATNFLKLTAKLSEVTAPSDLVGILRPAIDSVRQHLVQNNAASVANGPHRAVAFSEQPESSHTVKDTSLNFHNSSINTASNKVLQQQEQDASLISAIGRPKRNLADTFRYSTNEKESHEVRSTVQTIKVVGEKDVQDLTSQSKTRSGRRKGRMHKNRRRKKKRKGRNRKIPFWWTKHDGTLVHQGKDMCRRKSLTVDFEQIGWDDWIISPKSFNAHYCEGSCNFPANRHTDTSNHAAVQSVVRAMQINPQIPPPSCVPSATSDLTLLYFDEHGNLVLRSYPNMVVNKCGCR